MDPLSITASVIALAQLTTKILSLLNDAKGASRDREQCMLELSNSYGLLVSLRFRLESGTANESWYRSVSALNASNGPLDQYKQALEELQDSIASKDVISKLGQAIIWKLKKEEITSILSRIERLKSLVQVALEQDHLIDQRSKLSLALKTSIDAVHENTDELWSHEEKRQADFVTEWISSSNYPAQQSDIISGKQSDTGQWFLNSSEFQHWLTNSGQTLFCPGMPGAGKTMISALAVDHLTKSLKSESLGVAQIYCNYKTQADQTLAKLLAAILKQLAQNHPSCAKPLKELYSRHQSQKTNASLKEISDTLSIVISGLAKVFIVVDGLDECPSKDRTRERLVDALHDLQTKSGACLMFTSRFVAEIESQFIGLRKLEIRATEEDVRRFVSGRVAILPKCVQRNSGLLHEIEDTVAQAVDGMFLLARLYTDSLRDKNTSRAVHQAMKKFSGSNTDLERVYDEAYTEAIHRIDTQLPGDRELAWKVLAWITHAKRQLKVKELCDALAVIPNDEELDLDNVYDIEDAVSVCAGLVTVDEESRIVRLVHYTTQEYLERTREQWLPNADTDLALTCLTYLLFSTFRSGPCEDRASFEARKSKYALLKYVATYWFGHLTENEEVVRKACEFLQCSNALKSFSQVSWFTGLGNEQYYSEGFSGLHLIASLPLEFLANSAFPGPIPKDMIEAHNRKDTSGATPLTLAARDGLFDAVEWLLSKGANINQTAPETHLYGHALQAASMIDNEQMIQLLIDKGADVNLQAGEFGTALQVASLWGKEKVVKVLIENGADVNIQGGLYHTALQAASCRYDPDTVKLLLDKGAHVDALGGVYGTALQAASDGGQEKIARLLIDRGADVNQTGPKFGTAVGAAAREGRKQLIELLIENGADVNVVAGKYGTALQAAAYFGQDTMVELLIEKGADVNVQAGRCGSALGAAIHYGYERIAKILRDNGAREPVWL